MKDKRRVLIPVFSGLLIALSFLLTQCNKDTAVEKTAGVVSDYGRLHIEDLYLFNEHNDTVSLEGMSMFWHQWSEGKHYYNYDCLKWLRDDWHCDVIRAAVAVERGGYLEHPVKTKRKIFRFVEDCIDLGLYVIVDWHSHTAENSTEKAIEFFSEIAQRYGDTPNVIYEIYNEPLNVSWSDVVKPYLDSVIFEIRKYDPDNIIIVGSPQWSQKVDEAAEDPIENTNIAYTLHFYAGTHKQWLRDMALVALDKGLPLWVTEFGLCNSDGNGPIDHEESELWFEFMEKYKMSWCKWSVSHKEETSSVLKPGACQKGNWKPGDLTESGKIMRDKLISVNPR
jgi:endoglucanase